MNPITSISTLPDSLTFKKIWADKLAAPVSYIADLAGDESYEIRMLVADNPVTPVPVLEMLAEDDHPDVRYRMAENALLPPHILKILLHDENPYVVDRAQRTLQRLEEDVRLGYRHCA
jgi:hypothetical protein